LLDLDLKPVIADENRGVFVDVDRRFARRLAGTSNQPVRRIGVRGDIDALPIKTSSKTEYASRVPGMMHACGHDAHAAVVWGVMAILAELSRSGDEVPEFRCRGIFQPAEETSTGAKHMIGSGALQDVRAAIALHVDPTRLVETIGIREGAFTAGCDSFECEFEGRGGHGARPYLTSDTIDAMTAWVQEVYRRVPRVADARDSVVVNVGEFHAGEARNVVPTDGHLSGTLRALTMSASKAAMKQMQTISDCIAATHDCPIKLKFIQHTPPVYNDAAVNAVLTTSAARIVGESHVRQIPQPSMGAEDFSFIAEEIPSAMMRLGVAGIDIGSEPLHTSAFDIDEQALAIGAATLALAAIELSNPSAAGATVVPETAGTKG